MRLFQVFLAIGIFVLAAYIEQFAQSGLDQALVIGGGLFAFSWVLDA